MQRGSETRRTGFILRIAVTAASLLACASGQFYVDGRRGDDTDPGTIARPFSTVQRGVDAAANKPGHDTVIVFPTRTPYAGGVRIEDTSGGLCLRGLGLRSVVLEGGTTGIEVAFSDPVTIERLTVRGAGDGIFAMFTPITLVNVFSVDNTGHGLALLLSRAAIAGGSYSDNGDDGIHTVAFFNPTIEVADVVCGNNGDEGIDVFGAARVEATDSLFVGNAGYGLSILECNVRLHGLLVVDNNSGMRVSVNGELTDSAFLRNTGNGLELSQFGDLRISNCLFAANQDDGVALLGFHRAALDRCVLFGNGDDGLSIFDNESASIDRCVVFRNHGNGIHHVRPAPNAPTVRHTKIAFNRGAGILGWARNPPVVSAVRYFSNTLGDLVLR